MELSRVFRYCVFTGLSMVFFLIMFYTLPNPGGLATARATADIGETGGSSIMAIFTLLVVGSLGALGAYSTHAKNAAGPHAQQLDHQIKRLAYAIRSNNAPKAEAIYQKVYDLYHRHEPHSEVYNRTIHSLHKKLQKLNSARKP